MEEQLIPQLRFQEFEDEWGQVKLKDVSQYFNGGSFENDVSEKGKYELITLKSINVDGRLVHSKRYIDNEVSTLEKNTLVMILSEQAPGLLGMTALIPVKDKYVLNQRVAELRPNSLVDSYFLSMSINRNQRYFSKLGAGTKVQNITKPNVENYEFLSTSLPEQQKIASFLTDVDNKITKLTKKKDLLEQYKKGIMQKIFNQELRFKDDNGNAFPKWEVKKLGDICELNHGYQFRSSDFTKAGLAVIKISNVIGNQLNLDDITFIDEKRYDEFKRFEIQNGDILMSLTGNIGRVIEVNNKPFTLVQNYRVGKFEPFDKNVLIKPFLKYLLVSDLVFGRFNQLSNQSAQANFGKQDMNKITVQFPTTEEQTKIANFLSDIDLKIEALNTKIENCKAFKKGLLQKMFV